MGKALTKHERQKSTLAKLRSGKRVEISDVNANNANVYWTNSPTKEHEFLTVTLGGNCSILEFRQAVLKSITDAEKCQYNAKAKELDSEITIITSRGHFLSNEDDYLTIDDFKGTDNQGSELNVIVQTKKCGAVHINLESYNISPISLAFNLRMDTSATIRARVHEVSKIPDDKPLSIFYGIDKLEHIPEHQPLWEFWKDYRCIYYVVPIDGFFIYVRRLKGDVETVPAQPDMTIEKVKDEIKKLTNIPPDRQRLIFAGEQLGDNKTLSDYRIGHKSVIYLVTRLRGGGPPVSVSRRQGVSILGISFADLSDSRNLVQKSFSKSAPDWRITGEGLNIEGICRNSSCKAYNQQVIVPMGFLDFHLKTHSKMIRCPICNLHLKKIITCGFVSTFWRYFGRKAINPSELLFSNWAEVGGKGYTTFDVNRSDGGLKGMDCWKFLVIQARQICDDPRGKYPLPSHCAFCFRPSHWFGSKRLSCGHNSHKDCTQKSHFRCNLCIFN